jgi:hypothetical protein
VLVIFLPVYLTVVSHTGKEIGNLKWKLPKFHIFAKNVGSEFSVSVVCTKLKKKKENCKALS